VKSIVPNLLVRIHKCGVVRAASTVPALSCIFTRAALADVAIGRGYSLPWLKDSILTACPFDKIVDPGKEKERAELRSPEWTSVAPLA
jgi:hypothetical protein